MALYRSRPRVLLLVALLIVAGACFYLASAATPQPKNIIIMISDGCGFNQILATDYYQYGAAGKQVYERFPIHYADSTYSVAGSYDPNRAWSDFGYVLHAPTDSAAAATAMATGVKTYDAAIGVDPNGTRVQNLMEVAEARGKATGVVTSVPLSHATPASFIAHNTSRNNYAAIAQEMINQSAAEVIMGCGNPRYDNNGKLLNLPVGFDYVGGAATWKALAAGTAGADADSDGKPDPWTLIQSRQEFQNLAHGPTPRRVCGVPQAYSTLQQSRGGDAAAAPYTVPFNPNVPTLSEMSSAALNVLDNDPDGFVLMIEGGAIDWAGHGNQSGRLIEEEAAFNKAVETVSRWVEKHGGWDKNLVIVTADHETGYLTGPGSKPDIKPLVNNGAGKLPGMQWNSGGHTNSLVPFFAKGAGSEQFQHYAGKQDPVRGPYINNIDIALVVKSLLK
jgi:alkaline phosphatase